MIPNHQPLVAVFTDGTQTPVVAFNAKGRALIASSNGDLVMAAQQPRFSGIRTEQGTPHGD